MKDHDELFAYIDSLTMGQFTVRLFAIFAVLIFLTWVII